MSYADCFHHSNGVIQTMPLDAPTATLLLSFSLLLPSMARAEVAENEIPTVGRPANLPFSGASGDFRASTSVNPVGAEAQTPILFVLRIEAVAPVRRPPRRIDLRELPAFAANFDFLETDSQSERRPDDRTWEFVYRIQPKRDDIAAAPSVPFVFFNPDIQYPRKGFQVAYTATIPLTIRPREVFPVPLDAPENLFQLATGPGLLASQAAWPAPSAWALASGLFIPPLFCVAWYFIWRRLYPGAAALAGRRRSRAAREALQALQKANGLSWQKQAEAFAAAVADYLRARGDVSGAEIGPSEAEAGLSRVGYSRALINRGVQFFRDCDAARFGPDPTQRRPELQMAARRFILDMEAETWSASRSS